MKNPFRSQTFASCSVDFTIKIWSLDEHKKPKQTLSGHFGYVVDVVWADVDTLISGSYDGSVKVWNTSTAECLHSLVSLMYKYPSLKLDPLYLYFVVYFYQRLGAAHSKGWSKYALSMFFTPKKRKVEPCADQHR